MFGYGIAEQWRQLDAEERCYWRRVGAGLALLVLVIVFCLALAGCATDAIEMKVCQLRPLGRTESGDVIVLSACQTPEAFQASHQ